MSQLSHPSPAVEQKMRRALSPEALRTLFADARTAHAFLPQPVDRALLLRAAELTELGPTSGNSLPMRIVYVISPEGKERLKPAPGESNVAQTMQAPVTAICAADRRFFEYFARTSPQSGARMVGRWGDPLASEAAQTFAWDQALLQYGYFTLALRALGLDCGGMGGFDRAKVDAEFFPDGRLRSQFLLNIGYGDDAALKDRAPRLTLDELVGFV
jgi:3-hydroxypropanoate dehydrogenase